MRPARAGVAATLALAAWAAGAHGGCPPPRLWDRIIAVPASTESAVDVAVDGGGNVAVLDEVVTGGYQPSSFHLVQLTPAGDPAWSRAWDVLPDRVSARAVAANAAGAIAVGGLRTYGGLTVLLVQRWQSDGTLLWSRTRTGPGADQVNDVAINSAGDIAFAGFVGNDWIVGLYDAAGNLAWTDVYNSPASAPEHASAVVFDTGGNVIAAGDEERPDRSENANWLVRKYTAAGTLVWSRSVVTAGEDRAQSVAISRAGLILVGGFLRPTTGSWPGASLRTFDASGLPGPSAAYQTSWGGSMVSLAAAADGTCVAMIGDLPYGGYGLLRLGAGLEELWRQPELGFGVAVDGAGDVLTGSRGTYGVAQDSMVDKYRAYGPETCASAWSGLHGNAISAFPNPVSGDRCVVELSLEQPASRVVVEAYSVGHRLAWRGVWTGVTLAERAVAIKGIHDWAPGRYALRATITLADGTILRPKAITITVSR